MTNIYLAMYNFKIKINRGNDLELDKIPVDEKYRKNNMSEYVTFKDICNYIFNEGNFISETLKVCEVKPSNDPFFHAKLGLAEYGNKRGVYDGKNEIEKAPLDEFDKVLEPYFFMFCTPYGNNNEDGFFVIEIKKSKPIIKEFKKMLENHLREFNDELRVNFKQHIPNELKDVINEGIVNEYLFTIYENEKDKFDGKKLSTFKISMNVLEKIHPNEVDKNIIEKLKNKFSDFICDDKFKMKVDYNGQCTTLDINDMFNPKVFYLKIKDEDITKIKNNPTYDSMEKVSKKYIKSNFQYYINMENKSKLE